MLSTKRKQLVEKIVERDGELFRVMFAVSFEHGQIKPEIVSVVSLGKFDASQEVVTYLPSFSEKTDADFVFVSKFKESACSPFKDFIFVTGSKPRAPTHQN